MNFGDFENPIKSYINDHFTYQLVSGFNKQLKLHVKQCRVEMDDDYVKVENTQIAHFLDVDRNSMDIEVELSDGEILDLSVKLDGNLDIYKRISYSFFDLMGLLGGTYQILLIFWRFFIKLFSTEMLFSSVFRRLYFTNIWGSKKFNLTQINEGISQVFRDNKIE